MKRNLILILVVAALALAQQPVLIRQNSNTATVTAGGALKVDGSATTQPVSGTVTANQGGTWTVTGAGGTFPVTGTFWQATQPVSGTFWQATQPVSGTFWQATQPVSNAGTFAAQVTSILAADPCLGTAKVFFSISQTANARIITGTSAKKIYLCSFDVVGADAENISVVEGTGSTCATSTIAVPGFPAATAANGWNFAANGGISKGAGIGSIAGTSVNADDVCVFQSGSGRVSGGGSYVVQ